MAEGFKMVERTGNLNATPQYEHEHGCRSYVGELPTGHVCMKPEVVIHDGRMYCEEHRPQESRPMAEIQETAQWYTVNSGMDEIRVVIGETTKGTGRAGMNWQRLPPETKDALRRELYRIRSIGEAIDRDRNAREGFDTCPSCGNAIVKGAGVCDYCPKPSASEAAKPAAEDAPVYIDYTPEALKTPEGIARVNQAVKEFEDATANVANAADQLLKAHDNGTVTLYDWQELTEVVKDRRAKQEAFLRAMANQPAQDAADLKRRTEENERRHNNREG